MVAGARTEVLATGHTKALAEAHRDIGKTVQGSWQRCMEVLEMMAASPEQVSGDSSSDIYEHIAKEA